MLDGRAACDFRRAQSCKAAVSLTTSLCGDVGGFAAVPCLVSRSTELRQARGSGASPAAPKIDILDTFEVFGQFLLVGFVFAILLWGCQSLDGGEGLGFSCRCLRGIEFLWRLTIQSIRIV